MTEDQSATTPVLLNLGCGGNRTEEWIDVDVARNDLVQPDVLATVFDLPWEDDTVDGAYAGHLLEHLPWEEVPKALSEIRRVLHADAPLMVVGPDIGRVRARVSQHIYSPELIGMAIEGGGRWDEDVHQWVCTEAKLFWLLLESGYRLVETLAVQHVGQEWPVPTRVGWQAAVIGVK